MPDITVPCHSCSRATVFESVVGRGDECDGCGADLRVCLNCKFYDTSAYNECAEPSAERVLEKERSNFCDFFRPTGGKSQASGSVDENSTQGELDKLFGEK